ncbi:hypothetical protein SAMN05444149_10896 [Pseudosulfitobacter pseudonitzschiae]|uniref:Uncharacterized protein n=1 Tax=Pseudosulfitobacter pseudonitzschiae TaxID=1402135 RepID=A0A073IW24_9RHOB|nr:hypothetical protein [Pseudosulfitobacter pseudonitzschiae]KEJ93979.1 hypothetical protein SUH3_11960 [Pseudosulfitobacter pseudonitzschiae]SHG01546.1 hypothetical protein SAMN05444149_10896 [Pseudosulfitobacter pseudonitzschiae]
MADYTAQDLANINQLISGGLSQAMIAGEMVQYRTLPELLQIKRLIEAALAPASRVPFQVRHVATDRGV